MVKVYTSFIKLFIFFILLVICNFFVSYKLYDLLCFRPFFFGPTDTQITISGDGTVASENGQLGRLKIVKFKNELNLQQAGNSAFRPGDGNLPEEVEFPEVMQGALESSNVQPIIELTKMIEVHRSYNGAKTFIDKEDERQKTMIREMTKQA